MQNGSVQAIVYTCTSLYVHVSCMYGVSGMYERTHSVSVTLFWQKPKRHETVGTADLVVNDWNERRRRRPSVQLTHDTFESNNSSFVDLFPIPSTSSCTHRPHAAYICATAFWTRQVDVHMLRRRRQIRLRRQLHGKPLRYADVAVSSWIIGDRKASYALGR